MKSKCAVCHRSSNQTDGWWSVYELQRQYDLCPSCYRNRSLIAYKETIIEALQEIKISDPDPALHVAMQVMKQRCMSVVRDLKFND